MAQNYVNMNQMGKRKEDNSVRPSEESALSKTADISAFISELEPPAKDVSVIKYPKINSALGVLDRFLNKNLVLIIGIYALTMTLCTSGLVLTNVVFSHASTTTGTSGSAKIDLNTWLYSIIALFTFVVLVMVVYMIGRKRAKAKLASK